MTQHLKIVALGDFVLGVLDQLTFEFLNTPAFQANEMIVMFLFYFVTRDAVIEMSFRREPRLDQQLHGSVDRRVSDVGMFFPDGLIKIFTGDMTFGFEKGGKNQFSLLRMFELVLL